MKLVLYIAQTVNGYIAKENDETPWSKQIWDSYYKIANQFKAIILGRRTYEIMKQVNEFDKINNPFVIVLSNEVKQHSEIQFVKSPQEAIKLLKSKNFKEVLVGGGSKLNASFMKAGLIDEIILDIESLILGKGIKLFADEDFEVKLKLIKTSKLSDDIIQLHYKIKK